MELHIFKLQYFSRMVRYLHSVKSADIPTIGTLLSTWHAKITPFPIALDYRQVPLYTCLLSLHEYQNQGDKFVPRVLQFSRLLIHRLE